MDSFFILVCIIMFVVLLMVINSKISAINTRLDWISNQLFELHKKQKTEDKKTGPEPVQKPMAPAPPAGVVVPPPVVAEVPKPPAPPVPGTEQETRPAPKPILQPAPEPLFVHQPTFMERFRKNNPDLERFIGENLISKIGIAILVLGIAFFVKFAIDKNWINETARVGIGVFCGLLVNAIAHRLRKNFKAFSSVMAAGAIAIYYFTVAIGFQEYHLFSQTTAFIIMVVITIFSTVVSLAYDRQELAVLSLIGGFSTPLMVSTGQGNYVVLFTYLLILDIGILVVAYLRKWNIVNLCTYGFTQLFYVVWVFKEIFMQPVPASPYAGGMVFATLFYIVFTAMVVINDLKARRPFGWLELSLLLSSTAIYYGEGMQLLHLWQPEFKGLFTALMALFNLGLGIVVFKFFNGDRKLIYLLIGLALTLITLAAPVQLQGNAITLFWAAESVLLVWLAHKTGQRGFFYASMPVLLLSGISLVMDWVKYYLIHGQNHLPVLINKVFITGLFVAGCAYFKHRLMKRKEWLQHIHPISFDLTFYITVVYTFSVVLLYLTGITELSYQAGIYYKGSAGQSLTVLTYHFLFSAAVLCMALHRTNKLSYSMVLTGGLVNIVIYLISFLPLQFQYINFSLTSAFHAYAFYWHLLALLAIALHFYAVLFVVFNNRVKLLNIRESYFLWVLALAGVIILSGELMFNITIVKIGDWLTTQPSETTAAYHHMVRQIIKTGWPILWSCIAILLLVAGIRKRMKTLRVIALFLQAITIIKLFVYDINNVSEAGKIIAFIILGVLLLLMSFMYQKIKAIIFSDENREGENI